MKYFWVAGYRQASLSVEGLSGPSTKSLYEPNNLGGSCTHQFRLAAVAHRQVGGHGQEVVSGSSCVAKSRRRKGEDQSTENAGM